MTSQWINSNYQNFYASYLYFPFCGCYLYVNCTNQQYYREDARSTFINAFDNDGHGGTPQQVGVSGGTESLGWLYDTPGLYTVDIQALTNYDWVSYGYYCQSGYGFSNGYAYCTSAGSYSYYGSGQNQLFASFDVIVSALDAAAGPAAVPEPATLALLSLGLAGLGFSRRKKT